MRKKLIFNERYIQILFIMIILSSIIKFSLHFLESTQSYFYMNNRFLCSLYFVPLLYFHFVNEDIYLDPYVRVRYSQYKKGFYLSEVILVISYAFIVSLILYCINFIGQSAFMNFQLVFSIMFTLLIYSSIILFIHILRLFVVRKVCYCIVFIVMAILSFFEFIFPSFISPFVIFLNDLEVVSYKVPYMIGFILLNIIEIILLNRMIKKKGDLYE